MVFLILQAVITLSPWVIMLLTLKDILVTIPQAAIILTTRLKIMTATMLISRHNAASGNHSYDLESWKNANTQAGSQYRKRLSFLQQKEACSMKKYLVRHNAASGNHSYDIGKLSQAVRWYEESQYRKRLSFLRLKLLKGKVRDLYSHNTGSGYHSFD